MRFHVEIQDSRHRTLSAHENIEAPHTDAAIEAATAAAGMRNARVSGCPMVGYSGDIYPLKYRSPRHHYRDAYAIVRLIESPEERQQRARAAADAYFARHGRMP